MTRMTLWELTKQPNKQAKQQRCNCSWSRPGEVWAANCPDLEGRSRSVWWIIRTVTASLQRSLLVIIHSLSRFPHGLSDYIVHANLLQLAAPCFKLKRRACMHGWSMDVLRGVKLQQHITEYILHCIFETKKDPSTKPRILLAAQPQQRTLLFSAFPVLAYEQSKFNYGRQVLLKCLSAAQEHASYAPHLFTCQSAPSSCSLCRSTMPIRHLTRGIDR
jgi:hypothetical protein